MKNNSKTVAAGAILLASTAGAPMALQADPLLAGNFSATATFTTDYVFRGISLSDEGPAIQGSIDWGYNGFYAGVWGTNTNLEDDLGKTSEVEIDFYLGYANSFNGLDYDVGFLYYWYPGAPESFQFVDGPNAGNFTKLENDYVEFYLSLGYGFDNVPLEPYFGFFYAYSPDFFWEDGDAHAVEGSLALSLPLGFGLDGLYGYQTVDGDKATGSAGVFCDRSGPLPLDCNGFSYNYWSVGLTRDLAGFDLDLRYWDTDIDGDPLAGSRVVFTVSRTFDF